MDTPQNDNPAALDPVRKETGLVSKSGFLARRVRDLAQQARELNLADGLAVVFADKNLEAAVREALSKAEGPLTRGDLKRMKDLTAADKEIEDLTGLEHAVNLAKLHLTGNQISDVSPLASLTTLTSLDLWGNQISDVSPLASLTNLRYLNRSANPLSQESIDDHVPNFKARGIWVYP